MGAESWLCTSGDCHEWCTWPGLFTCNQAWLAVQQSSTSLAAAIARPTSQLAHSFEQASCSTRNVMVRVTESSSAVSDLQSVAYPSNAVLSLEFSAQVAGTMQDGHFRDDCLDAQVLEVTAVLLAVVGRVCDSHSRTLTEEPVGKRCPRSVQNSQL